MSVQEFPPQRSTAQRLTHHIVGLLAFVMAPRSRDERGLSQSTETAILIVAALGVATAIMGVVGAYVTGRLAVLGAP